MNNHIISPLQNAEFFVQNDEYIIKLNDKFFVVSASFFSILKKFSKNISIQEITTDSAQQIIIEKKISQFIASAYKVNEDSYIKSRKTIISEGTTSTISNSLKFLFYNNFYILFPTVVITNIFLFFYFNGLSNYSTFNFSFLLKTLAIYPLIVISIIFHEFGHIAACQSFNIKPRKIGFGFYFIFPVLFSDVTNIWSLPMKQKIIVNLGGIYLQLITNLFWFILHIFLPSPFKEIFLHIFFFNIFSSFFIMLPFFRNDGYWIYSDFFRIKNLYKKSDEYLKNMITNTKQIRSYPLLLFTIANWSYRFIVLYVLFRITITKAYTVISTHYLSVELFANIIWLLVATIGLYLALKNMIFSFLNINKVNSF